MRNRPQTTVNLSAVCLQRVCDAPLLPWGRLFPLVRGLPGKEGRCHVRRPPGGVPVAYGYRFLKTPSPTVCLTTWCHDGGGVRGVVSRVAVSLVRGDTPLRSASNPDNGRTPCWVRHTTESCPQGSADLLVVPAGRVRLGVGLRVCFWFGPRSERVGFPREHGSVHLSGNHRLVSDCCVAAVLTDHTFASYGDDCDR